MIICVSHAKRHYGLVSRCVPSPSLWHYIRNLGPVLFFLFFLNVAQVFQAIILLSAIDNPVYSNPAQDAE